MSKEARNRCPKCGNKHSADRPVLVNGRLEGLGCEECYRRQGGTVDDWDNAWAAASGRTGTIDGLEPMTLVES